jgi:predicted ATPase
MEPYFRIEKVSIENFRSILRVEVRLSPITFFIGPNGSGKTSFLDALFFVRDSLRHSPEKAAKDRHGIYSFLHAPVRLPCVSRFAFDVASADGFSGYYSVEIEAQSADTIVVSKEECKVSSPDGTRHHYIVENGEVSGSATVFPAVSTDRLYLVNASGLPEFRPIYDFLSEMKNTEPSQRGLYLLVDNLNVKSDTRFTTRYQQLMRMHPGRADIIRDYLRAVAPPFDRFDVVEINGRTWLRFIEKHEGNDSNRFYMSQVSGGLLHAADMLLELFEPPKEGNSASLVAIEEPEALLHPGAIRVLRDAFLEASGLRQILITSHSPELIDDPSIPADWIRSVYRTGSGTHIESLDSATQSILRENLFTAGELLRQGGLAVRSQQNSTPESKITDNAG